MITKYDTEQMKTQTEGRGYCPDQQRWKTELRRNDSLAKTVIFAGDYERVVKNDTVTHLYYMEGGGIYVRQVKGASTLLKDGMYYVHPDHLGSLTIITDAAGNVKQKCTFDAWGKRMFVTKDNTLIFDRGFTGHEHLDEFGLINMNGRMYDPIVGRFLSPDPFVADGTFSQDYNRYSYARNNPLIYTDPDGEFVHLIVGAVIGGFMNLMMNAHNVDNFWQGLGYFGIGAAAGALGAGVGAGISSAMAGGTFGAGFVGSSAAMSASSSFITGAAIGGGAGFASGFTTGLGNGLMGGQNFGQALGSGLKGGAIGGLSGAAIGGIVGGIQNQRQLIAFRKGNQSLGINGSDPVPATDEFLSKAQKAWYKNAPMDKVRTFTVENVPASIQNTLDANNAPALTRALSTGGKLIGFSNVYFNNNLAFLSAKDLFYSMGHEFVHVSQFAALAGQSASLLRQPGFMDMLEFHAYSYQNTLGGTQFSSFTRAEIINWQNTYPQLFNSMGWMSFPWTSAHSFSYPF